MAEPQEPDRPNPFAGPLSPDADSVVQMFLMNQTANRGQQQPQQRPLFITGLSATSPGSPGNPGITKLMKYSFFCSIHKRLQQQYFLTAF